MKRICVFCGSSMGLHPGYDASTRILGQLFVEKGIELVYGGGNVGLMGIIADTVLARGGKVIGVIPQSLVMREVAHDGLTQLHVVNTLHERKALMAELSDAFITLPGGYGTLEELCEVLSWAQLGLHQKPCGLLNVEGFYTPLVEFLDRLVTEKFLRPHSRELLLEDTDPVRLLYRLATYEPPKLDRWSETDSQILIKEQI